MRTALLSLGLLVLRLSAAGLMFFGHGLGKIQKFDELAAKFPDPLGVGNKTSLILAIGGEVVCPVLVAVGLLTRLGALGTAFTMGVAAFVIHANDPLLMYMNPQGPTKEPALLFMAMFATLVFTGPGCVSIDALIFRKSKPVVTTPPPARATTRPI